MIGSRLTPAVFLLACGSEAPVPYAPTTPEAPVAGAGASAPLGATAKFKSALDPAGTVNELSRSDWTTLCHEIAGWSDALVSGAPAESCLLGGLALTATSDGCDAAVAECEGSLASAPAPNCAPTVQMACGVSVGEVESCLSAIAATVASVDADLSCASAGDAVALGRVLTPIAAAPSCAALQSRCPSLAGSVMPGATGM